VYRLTARWATLTEFLEEFHCSHVSLVIVAASSVCVEAMILGKPVISVNISDCRDLTGLVQDSLAIGVYNEDEIKRSIETCLEVAELRQDQDDGKRMLLFPFVHTSDGHASQRVADLIKAKSTKNSRLRHTEDNAASPAHMRIN
jgi:hypothetical protein